MAKVTPANLATDALWRVRGVAYLRLTKWGVIAQKWPGKRTRPAKRAELQRMADFGAAGHSSVYADPQIMASFTEMARGSENVPRDLATLAALGTLFQVTLPDGTKLLPARYMLPDPTSVLDQITALHGAMLFRGPDEWLPVLPGQPGQLLGLTGLQPTWRDEPSISGPATWTVLYNQAIPTGAATANFPFAAQNELAIMARNITTSLSAVRNIKIGTGSPVVYQTAAGAYSRLAADGTEVAVDALATHSGASTATRSVYCHVINAKGTQTAPLAFMNMGETRGPRLTAAAITGVQVHVSAGTITGGTITIYGR